jgi:hypothetical protein
MRDLDRRLGGSPEHSTSLEVAFDELSPRQITGNPEVNRCYQAWFQQ